ncbi:kinase domain-containing protein [Rhexocercosporidium sp. MPI-PUGE-AT-0058]|nr:kinase domain-containing protein [Rhexocercosporidium sp. MPI-PUGE-AT-0058]
MGHWVDKVRCLEKERPSDLRANNQYSVVATELIKYFWPLLVLGEKVEGRFCRLTNGAFASLTHRVAPASESSLILNPDVPIEEEVIPDYNPKNFYPTVAKVGWGTCSTVWLARDLNRERQADRYVVLKVNNCDFSYKESADDLKTSQHLAAANPLHNGHSLVRTVIDSFAVTGPNGTHIMSLDYLHSECQIIHTDLKFDNILVGFEDPSVIEDFVQGQVENPMAQKLVNGRSIYQLHNNFGPLRSLYILPKIAGFGLAQRGDSSQLHLLPIQPDHYRAPEVVLGRGWTYSADIWNLGVLIWNLLENKDLFTRVHSAEGKYTSQAHLAEIIELLGPPPKNLIDRERDGRTRKWGLDIENAQGKLCDRASTYYGRPSFDSQGEFIHKDLIPSNLHLTNSVTSIQGEEKNLFLLFARKMLQWLPEDRKAARELLEEPWLNV